MPQMFSFFLHFLFLFTAEHKNVPSRAVHGVAKNNEKKARGRPRGQWQATLAPRHATAISIAAAGGRRRRRARVPQLQSSGTAVPRYSRHGTAASGYHAGRSAQLVVAPARRCRCFRAAACTHARARARAQLEAGPAQISAHMRRRPRCHAGGREAGCQFANWRGSLSEDAYAR